MLKKYDRDKQATDDMLDIKGYRRTLRICDIHRFYTTITCIRKRLVIVVGIFNLLCKEIIIINQFVSEFLFVVHKVVSYYSVYWRDRHVYQVTCPLQDQLPATQDCTYIIIPTLKRSVMLFLHSIYSGNFFLKFHWRDFLYTCKANMTNKSWYIYLP